MKRLYALFLIPVILFALVSTVLAAPLNQIYGIIEAFSVNPVSSAVLRNTKLEDIASLINDPYFKYFPPPEFRHYLENHQGEFGGIGVTVQQLEGRIIVVSVQPGSPADRAGIKIGDEITAVDGINVKGMSIVELSQLLRGAPGSTVAVGYLQEGRPHTAVMIREIIEILTVRGFMKDRVAVIEIIGFTEKTPEEFRRVLKILRLQLPDGLIVDLRGNPGGSLFAALEVAEELVPTGPLVRLRERQGRETVLVSVSEPALFPYLAVLVDENSASAAEILAGAVQDSGAGTIVGSRSYGKGTVQGIFKLDDGGGLRLTISHFLTPGGRPIEGAGIIPDIEITSPYVQLPFAVSLVKANAARQMTFTIGELAVRTPNGIRTAEYAPFIVNNRSYIPLRLLAECLGYLVEWDNAAFTATLDNGYEKITIPLRRHILYRQGKEIKLEEPIIIRNNRSFLPARAVAEALGCSVYWDNNARQVTVRW